MGYCNFSALFITLIVVLSGKKILVVDSCASKKESGDESSSGGHGGSNVGPPTVIRQPPEQQQSNKLDCDFDQQNFCLWVNAQNNVEDDFDWKIEKSVAIDGFHSIPRTVTGTGYFAYAQGRFAPSQTGQAARAWLFCPPMNGLENPATLRFMYWKTAAPPVLQVCTRDTGENRLKCFDSITGVGDARWNQRSVVIPTSTLPFQIIFVAVGFSSALDLVGLDDVTLRFAEGERLGQVITGNNNNNNNAFARYYTVPHSRQIGGGSYSNIPGQNLIQAPPPSLIRRPGSAETHLQPPQPHLQPYGVGGGGINVQGDQNPAHQPVQPQIETKNSKEEYGNGGSRESSPSPNVVVQETTHVSASSTAATTTEPPTSTTTTTTFKIPPLPAQTGHEYSQLSAETTESPKLAIQSAPIDSLRRTPTTYRSQPSPPANNVNARCEAVDCPFNRDFCSWYNDLSANFDWKLKYTTLKGQDIGYIFANGDFRKFEQKASIKSPPFVVPRDAFIDFLVFMSEPDAGRLSIVYHRDALPTSDRQQPPVAAVAAASNIVWQMTGYKGLGEEGWRRMRIALPVFEYPIALAFVADQLTVGQSIGVDDVHITDKSGTSIGCETPLGRTAARNDAALAVQSNVATHQNLISNVIATASPDQSRPAFATRLVNNNRPLSGLSPAQIREALIGETEMLPKLSIAPYNDFESQTTSSGRATSSHFTQNDRPTRGRSSRPGVGTIVEESLPEVLTLQDRRLHDIQEKLSRKQRKPTKFKRVVKLYKSAQSDNSVDQNKLYINDTVIESVTFATTATTTAAAVWPTTNLSLSIFDSDPLGFKDFVGLVGKDLQSLLQSTGQALYTTYNNNNKNDNNNQRFRLLPTIL